VDGRRHALDDKQEISLRHCRQQAGDQSENACIPFPAIPITPGVIMQRVGAVLCFCDLRTSIDVGGGRMMR
jgi:hypothetical protein